MADDVEGLYIVEAACRRGKELVLSTDEEVTGIAAVSLTGTWNLLTVAGYS